jgi:hypothetical protein
VTVRAAPQKVSSRTRASNSAEGAPLLARMDCTDTMAQAMMAAMAM